MKRAIVVGVAAMVGAVVVAGCSSSTAKSSGPKSSALTSASPAGSSAASSTPATSSSAQPSPSTGATSAGASSAKLLAITVQQADLPAGYTSTPYQADPSDASTQAALVQCVGGHNTAADETGDANSPSYSSGELNISSEAESYRSQADLNDDIAIIKSPKISTCYQQLLRSQLAASQPGITINSITLTFTPGPGNGPSNVVGTAAGHVTITASGKSATIYVNVAFITGPLIEAEIDFEGLGQPVPAALQSALITKVAMRAAAG